ncbi:MAG TPA: PEP-CTERM sorting domain-containing protein [Bryobacteraceae bacterium]|nr:PEP-CTERM sorting domain-containing protein [Bryobacteraceae bacterium]
MKHLKSSRAVVVGALLALSAIRLCANSVDVVFYDNRFGSINDTTGSWTQISTLPIDKAGGVAISNNLMYLEDFGDNLFTVDSITGAAHLVGNTGLGLSIGAFAGGNTGLFEIDWSSNLYSINPATGKGAKIGATGLVANNGAFDTSLSMSGGSLYYTAGRAGQADELYLLNPATAAATDLGSTGVTGIAGSALVNGQLELYQYGQSTNYIYSAPVNTLEDSTHFTRGAVLQAQIIDGGVAVPNAAVTSASPENTPEPATIALAGFGLLVVAVVLRRRRVLAPVN